MKIEIVQGILLPFFETALGSACVFIMKAILRVLVQWALPGFAAGVMVAASIWSLLINIGTLFLAAGFTVMLALDVALG